MNHGEKELNFDIFMLLTEAQIKISEVCEVPEDELLASLSKVKDEYKDMAIGHHFLEKVSIRALRNLEPHKDELIKRAPVFKEVFKGLKERDEVQMNLDPETQKLFDERRSATLEEYKKELEEKTS